MTRYSPPPPEARALYDAWRSPRFGTANPERMTNPVWQWLVETRAWPGAAHELLAGAEVPRDPPSWTFDRMGQSRTELPDGTAILIGGEHEDWYDPDFQIYNDVTLLRPGAAPEIYGYPEAVFPPTDFHSATLAGGKVWIVGTVGPKEMRDPARTPVFTLDVETLEIAPVQTTGTPPAWLHRHDAALAEGGGSIRLTGGTVIHAATGAFIDNLDTWSLDLATGAWSRDHRPPVTRWLVRRTDRGPNNLWRYRVLDHSEPGSDMAREMTAELEATGPKPGLARYRERFRLPVPHEDITTLDDAYNLRRIRVEEATVRITEEMAEIQVTVEGPVAPATLDAIRRHVLETCAALDGADYETVDLA